MQRAIRLHEGLVLQYVGDEIEAVFGVPLKCEGHADQAVRAALEMRRTLENLNETRVANGKPPFAHGIGICTGEVLAGNTGSEDHLSYALIGKHGQPGFKDAESDKNPSLRYTHKRRNRKKDGTSL